ncbi:hypothetical protein KYK29_00110 [Shinella daejeonensis]|uniref:hypothetical protein n=1 Tax=Shinella daejeonensis TaxID=659017 RepID=UPI0020C772F6|nr:hypothetical protein [Shinella daejeonensis]MCP8893317.1 hypothetical protein [Shinella daejeonensis]
MEITFERDSVCAGDDVLAPNSRTIAFSDKPRLSEILSESGPLLAYMPCVQASTTHWLAWIDKECVAKVAFTCEPQRVLAVSMLVPDRCIDANRIYFSEDGQERAGQS